MQRELELYVQAGIPAAQALKIATWNGAKHSDRLAEIGSITVGKRADLVLLDGDPVADIRAGLFTLVGAGTATNPNIGPTPYLHSKLPIEATPAEFEHADSASAVAWSESVYESFLPPSWRGHAPIKEAWLAGRAGRDELLIHGTTINPAYYASNPWYPGTPQQGCLISDEAWDPPTGRLLTSRHLTLAQVYAANARGDLAGYLIVVDVPGEGPAPVELQRQVHERITALADGGQGGRGLRGHPGQHGDADREQQRRNDGQQPDPCLGSHGVDASLDQQHDLDARVDGGLVDVADRAGAGSHRLFHVRRAAQLLRWRRLAGEREPGPRGLDLRGVLAGDLGVELLAGGVVLGQVQHLAQAPGDAGRLAQVQARDLLGRDRAQARLGVHDDRDLRQGAGAMGCQREGGQEDPGGEAHVESSDTRQNTRSYAARRPAVNLVAQGERPGCRDRHGPVIERVPIPADASGQGELAPLAPDRGQVNRGGIAGTLFTLDTAVFAAELPGTPVGQRREPEKALWPPCGARRQWQVGAFAMKPVRIIRLRITHPPREPVVAGFREHAANP
ncbi:hypothetical protein OSTOST_07001 [Ostertagia ostertagi]